MVICLGQGAGLHMAQLMPLPLLSLAPVIPDWFYRNGSAFLVLAYQVVLKKRLLNECSL